MDRPICSSLLLNVLCFEYTSLCLSLALLQMKKNLKKRDATNNMYIYVGQDYHWQIHVKPRSVPRLSNAEMCDANEDEKLSKM